MAETLGNIMSSLRALSDEERRKIFCWFCGACGRFVGPGDACQCVPRTSSSLHLGADASLAPLRPAEEVAREMVQVFNRGAGHFIGSIEDGQNHVPLQAHDDEASALEMADYAVRILARLIERSRAEGVKTERERIAQLLIAALDEAALTIERSADIIGDLDEDEEDIRAAREQAADLRALAERLKPISEWRTNEVAP